MYLEISKKHNLFCYCFIFFNERPTYSNKVLKLTPKFIWRNHAIK